ncbi:GNAT family N-acetyltransferase [Octadecabacter sp. R77987]|uniref:GNAT family N-acetyltransferase n=1 Tax=Octadecabacter sp. R77987 TaxID=3093874 RepID=UPI00367200F5
MTRLTIRSASIADLDEMRAVFDAGYAQARADIPDLPDVTGGLADDLVQQTCFAALWDDAIVGGLVLGLQDDYGHLVNVAVSPDHGGKGVARALITAAEDACRAAGLRELRLATHVKMPQNVVIYGRMGWIETGRDDRKVEMVKQL